MSTLSRRGPNANAAAKLPGIQTSRVHDPAVRQALEALREWVEVRLGSRGDKYERAVTLRDLETLGLIESGTTARSTKTADSDLEARISALESALGSYDGATITALKNSVAQLQAAVLELRTQQAPTSVIAQAVATAIGMSTAIAYSPTGVFFTSASTSSMLGISYQGADALGAGVATVSGVSAAIAEAYGTAAGTATVAGIPSLLVASTAAAASTSSSAAFTQSTVLRPAAATAAGAATMAGVGVKTSKAAASAAGIATVSGVFRATKKATGTAAGVAATAASSRATKRATATAAGIATASAVGSTPAAFRGPKIAALDYRVSGAGSFDVATHQKYDISIIGMLRNQAAPGGVGRTFVTNLRAVKPEQVILQYTIHTQMYRSTAGEFPLYQEISDILERDNSWARDAITGRLTKTYSVKDYPGWEVNISEDVPPNAAGFRPTEEIASFFHTYILSGLYPVGLNGAFHDNVWTAPGSTTSGQTVDSTGALLPAGKAGDYNLDGGNDSLGLVSSPLRNNPPAPNFRKGHVRSVNRLRALQPGALVMANADADNVNDANYGTSALATAELTGLYDYAFLEGVNGKSYSYESYRNIFADTLRRYTTSHNNVRRAAVLNTYVDTTTQTLSRRLQHARYGLGISLLGDGYHCCVDQGTGLSPFWFDEINPALANIGTAIDPMPTVAWSGGVWRRRYQNGVVLVNPVANKGRQLQSAAGSVTLARLGNEVTLTWSAMSTSMTHGKVVGDKIRILDCATSSFNGTFVLTFVDGTRFKWAQTGADVSLTDPYCFFALQTTVDLTGLGYRRILGTDDAHNDYDNGTSQNDGSVITTVTTWSGDALIAVK